MTTAQAMALRPGDVVERRLSKLSGQRVVASVVVHPSGRVYVHFEGGGNIFAQYVKRVAALAKGVAA